MNRFLDVPRLAQLHLIREIGSGNEFFDNEVALLPRLRGERVLIKTHYVGMNDRL